MNILHNHLSITTGYSNKAKMYAKYRWDYSRAAVSVIFQRAQLSRNSVVADIGAGTGILTKHFLNKCQTVYAVEPNKEMRAIAQKTLKDPRCKIIEANSEDTTIPQTSVDLITAAQSIHWFNPTTTRLEFLRILKPQGWLAILNNRSTNSDLNNALKSLYTPSFGVSQISPGHMYREEESYYFGKGEFDTLTFPFQYLQNWEQFFGSLLSAAQMPDKKHKLFPGLEKAAKKVFSDFSHNEYMQVQGETVLFIGQPFIE